VRSDEFSSRKPDHDVDHRVHLYGGRRRAITPRTGPRVTRDPVR
jgi:hypothetical protein